MADRIWHFSSSVDRAREFAPPFDENLADDEVNRLAAIGGLLI
jgi:hypothetical protein